MSKQLIKTRLTLDAASKRIEDHKNGYLRVLDNPFTREQVVEYRGFEIPQYKEHGLKPNELYKVYRPASELRKEATINSINGIPLLLEHETWDPDDPPLSRSIGSAGTDGKWDPPYLKNSLTFTNTKAINYLKSGTMKELSLGYYYDPVFEHGTTKDGEHYDVKMTNIIANHIALVEEGRAGPDVAVQDSKPKDSKQGNITMDMQQFGPDVARILSELYLALSKLNNTNGAPAPGQDEEDEELQSNKDPISQDDDVEQTEQAQDDDEQEAPTGDPTAPENDNPALKSEDDPDLDKLSNDEDEEQAQDDDEEQAQDEDEEPKDEQAQDEDEEQKAALDMDDDALKALLEEDGLSDAPDEVKAAYIKALKRSLKVNEMASDSKKGSLSKFLNKAINKRIAVERLKDKTKYNAANEVKSVLGNINAMAYDSAGAIYKHALQKYGFTKAETRSLSDNEARASFRAMKIGNAQGRSKLMAKDSKEANKLAPADACFEKLIKKIK